METFGFSGQLLSEGFWLYVWRVKPRRGAERLYVGMTGDIASDRAQSPFNRMSAHLGSNVRNNALKTYLRRSGLRPESCHFELIAKEIQEPARTQAAFRSAWEDTRGLERRLADGLNRAGYVVMNHPINNRQQCSPASWAIAHRSFVRQFPRLPRQWLPSSRQARMLSQPPVGEH